MSDRPKFLPIKQQAAELATYAASHGLDAAREKLGTMPPGVQRKVWQMAFGAPRAADVPAPGGAAQEGTT